MKKTLLIAALAVSSVLVSAPKAEACWALNPFCNGGFSKPSKSHITPSGMGRDGTYRPERDHGYDNFESDDDQDGLVLPHQTTGSYLTRPGMYRSVAEFKYRNRRAPKTVRDYLSIKGYKQTSKTCVQKGNSAICGLRPNRKTGSRLNQPALYGSIDEFYRFNRRAPRTVRDYLTIRGHKQISRSCVRRGSKKICGLRLK